MILPGTKMYRRVPSKLNKHIMRMAVFISTLATVAAISTLAAAYIYSPHIDGTSITIGLIIALAIIAVYGYIVHELRAEYKESIEHRKRMQARKEERVSEEWQINS